MFPRLLQFGMLTIPTQGACIALGLMLALLLAVRTARLLALDADRIWNLGFLAAISFILGGRVVLILMHWHDYASYPALLLVVSIHSPALLIASTVIALVCCTISLRLHPLPLLRTLDALAAPLSLGYGFACIGAFAAGAEYGTPANVPWAVRFHSGYALAWNGTPQNVPLHPVQLYQAVFEFLLCGLLLWLLTKDHSDGEIAGAWLFLGGISGFLFELIRGGRGIELFDGTQVASLLMLVLGAILLMDRKGNPQVQPPGNEEIGNKENNAL